MSHYRVHRADGNTREIVDGLRKAGRSVLMIASATPGVPDLLVAFRGRMVLADVKKLDAKGRVSAGAARSRERQAAWAARWQGPAVQEWPDLATALAATEFLGPGKASEHPESA